MENSIKTKKLYKGAYLVVGKNVSMEISNDMGYWEIDEYSENNKGFELINFHWMQYETKKEAVCAVQCYDLEAQK